MIKKPQFVVPLLLLWMTLCSLKAGIEAGAAAIEITPEMSLRMAGYSARKEPSKGVMDPLFVRAMVLRNADRSVGFVVYDLIGTLGRELNARLTSEIKEEIGLGEVLFIATHSHAGPVLRGADDDTSLPVYERGLYAQTKRALQEAWENDNSLAPQEPRMYARGAIEVATELVGSLQTALLSDPSDYTVAEDNTIEVQPLETLGHYADWLGIRTQRLRDINGFAFRTPVEVGKRIKLEFAEIDAQAFENLRVAYHRSQQDHFFRQNVITGVTEHTVNRGESVWILSLREYDVPVWLFRQYNPSLDPQRVTPGTTIRFPTLKPAQGS